MAAWPTLREVRSWVRQGRPAQPPDEAEDALIDTARRAAIDFGIRRLGGRYDEDADNLPYSAHLAALMDAGRLYRRRDSLDGTIGFGDLGAVRVGRADPDVERLYASAGAPVVFG
jgi:hypothetical protein